MEERVEYEAGDRHKPEIRGNATQALMHLRYWLRRGMILDDEQRIILHDVVSLALAQDDGQAEGEPEEWPAIEQLRAIHLVLQKNMGRHPDALGLLARVVTQISAYDRGIRNDGLRWQIMAAIGQFTALQAKLKERGDDDAERSKGRYPRRRR